MKATVIPAIERVEKVVIEPKKVVLELSVAEAHVLFALKITFTHIANPLGENYPLPAFFLFLGERA